MKPVLAVGQMTSTTDKKENLDCCLHIIEQAKRQCAQFVSLPENFAFLGETDEALIEASENLDCLFIKRLRDCAKKHNIFLSLGGFHEKDNHSNKIFNSHIIIDDQGEISAIYRKIHLFSARLPDGSVYDEAKVIKPGDEVVCFKAPTFLGGLAICYDLRFPNLFAALRKKGAEVLFVPAAFTAVTGKDHWEVLLRARAIETQSYVIAAAQIGRHNKRRVSHGHAMIVDPWGTLLAQCGQTQHVAVAEIDLASLRTIRKQMPIFKHKRNFLNE